MTPLEDLLNKEVRVAQGAKDEFRAQKGNNTEINSVYPSNIDRGCAMNRHGRVVLKIGMAACLAPCVIMMEVGWSGV